MKELEYVNPEILDRFNTDNVEYMNNISDIIERDMARYNRIINAEEETNEH